MSIQQFYNAASKHDFARVFQFQLDFLGNIPFGESQLAYVETASLPGRSITNIAVPYMGLAFNVPGTATYPGSTGYNVTFRCDENFPSFYLQPASSIKGSFNYFEIFE